MQGSCRMCQRRSESGVAMITALVALIALIGAAALAIDAGHVLVARTQMQAAVDSSALAGAANLIDTTVPSSPVVTRAEALVAAQTYASSNQASHDAVDVLPADVEFGTWDAIARTFTTPVSDTVPELNTAVRVTARLDGNANPALPSLLAQVLGRDSFDVGASAIAYLGYAGSTAEGEVELPIALDCCELSGPACDGDYCATVASPPNPCDLSSGVQQDEGLNTVTCLEFYSTPEQNSCWTVFDGDSASVNAPGLLDIVQDGAPAIDGSPVYLDNGDKTPVIAEIHDKFYGEGAYTGNPSGQDYYPGPDDPRPDSWVTVLPVVECQDDAECAGGDAFRIVGFACFEIREVIVTPDKIVKGTLMCPGHPRFDTDCKLPGSGTGGYDFGLRAEIPVLVD